MRAMPVLHVQLYKGIASGERRGKGGQDPM